MTPSTLDEIVRASADSRAEAYFVGGCVRDVLLGEPLKDVDIVMCGPPAVFVKSLEKILGVCPVAYRRFGTFVFRTSSGGLLDVASSREETYSRPGALPDVRTGATIEKDLSRRDFTINAMAVPVSSPLTPSKIKKNIIDPHGGLADLDAKLIRVIHSKSFVDDPTRIIRAARFAARFGFTIEKETAALIETAVASCAASSVSDARKGKELLALAREKDPIAVAALLYKWRAASAFFPELPAAPADFPRPAFADDFSVALALSAPSPEKFLAKYCFPKEIKKRLKLRGRNP